MARLPASSLQLRVPRERPVVGVEVDDLDRSRSSGTIRRGAHQRDDFPLTDPEQTYNLITRLDGEDLSVTKAPLVLKPFDLIPLEAAE